MPDERLRDDIERARALVHVRGSIADKAHARLGRFTIRRHHGPRQFFFVRHEGRLSADKTSHAAGAKMALDFDARERLQPKEAAKAFTAPTSLVRRVDRLEAVEIVVREPNAAVRDRKALDGSGFSVVEIALTFRRNPDVMALAAGLLDRLKGIDDRFEERQQRLGLRQIRVADATGDTSFHDEPISL